LHQIKRSANQFVSVRQTRVGGVHHSSEKAKKSAPKDA
jgi:hypothetical protein